MDPKRCYVPHDIVGNILSRLPVKSLNRFKGVCKQWSATISDPRFAETHLQQSNPKPCSFLKLHNRRLGAFNRVLFENEQLQELSTVEYHPLRHTLTELEFICHCDGLFLHWRRRSVSKVTGVVVWNPSNRTFKEVCCPYNSIVFNHGGICYDPLLKDYKVVIGDTKSYAVYYCRRKSWSQLKEMTPNINIVEISRYNYSHHEGVCYKGSIYWIFSSRSFLKKFEIVCFHGRDEKFKNFRTPDCKDDHAQLISSQDCLYFVASNWFHEPSNEMVIMKKEGDEDDPWMELKLKLAWPCFTLPICSMAQENKIMLMALNQEGDDKYLLYHDDTERVVKEIQTTPRPGINFSNLIPLLENLISL